MLEPRHFWLLLLINSGHAMENFKIVLKFLETQTEMGFESVSLLETKDNSHCHEDVTCSNLYEELLSNPKYPTGVVTISDNGTAHDTIRAAYHCLLIVHTPILLDLVINLHHSAWSKNIWLIVVANEDCIIGTLVHRLNQIKNIRLDSQVYIWNTTSSGFLTEVYRIQAKTELMTQMINLKSKKAVSLWQRRRDLKAIFFTIIIRERTDLAHLDFSTDPPDRRVYILRSLTQ